jgi:MFS family permease
MATRKTSLERMDDLVRWTGIPALATYRVPRRKMRVAPVIALLPATAGMVFCLADPKAGWFGFGAVILGLAIAGFLPTLGPVIPWGAQDAVTEADRELRRRAFLAAFASMSVAAILGLWAMIAVAIIAAPKVEMLMREMLTLCLYLITLYSAVPTLYASWRRAGR